MNTSVVIMTPSVCTTLPTAHLPKRGAPLQDAKMEITEELPSRLNEGRFYDTKRERIFKPCPVIILGILAHSRFLFINLFICYPLWCNG